MTFEKADIQDISALTNLRIAYLQEDLGTIIDNGLYLIKASLPVYYEKHINKQGFVGVCCKGRG